MENGGKQYVNKYAVTFGGYCLWVVTTLIESQQCHGSHALNAQQHDHFSVQFLVVSAV
jgi:hypothetical protein